MGSKNSSEFVVDGIGEKSGKSNVSETVLQSSPANQSDFLDDMTERIPDRKLH